MKKSIILLIVLIIVGFIIWKFNSTVPVVPGGEQPATSSTTTEPFITVSEKTKVSDKISEYKNGELGFSVKYSPNWKVLESFSKVSFIAPIDTSSKNSVDKLESSIEIAPGKCSFPPVTTIKERKSIKINNLSFNMISMSNSVQGKNYFDRMYTLQKDAVCYVFRFSSITLNPTTKGFSGGEVQQINANNKAIVDSTDLQFQDLVKSFAFVIGPAGEDEAKISPASSTPKNK